MPTCAQFFADQIDQLDLALDQLAIRDRNYDRFALMLVDNVVELLLHRHARDCAFHNQFWSRFEGHEHDPQLVADAMGPKFDRKVKLAKASGLVADAMADSLLYLHNLRNVVYHAGLRHERILHAVTVFYFKAACEVLQSYKPRGWSSGSDDRISHRAVKYIGAQSFRPFAQELESIWSRLREVALSMGDTLVDDLALDLSETITSIDDAIDFIVREAPGGKMNRDEVVVQAQVWPVAVTEKGRAFAQAHGYNGTTIRDYLHWMTEHYDCDFRKDPVPGWNARLASLKSEKSGHVALKKYTDFMKQTEAVRAAIDEMAAQVDSHVQDQVDAMRGK